MTTAEKVDKITRLLASGLIDVTQAKILLGIDPNRFQVLNNELLYYSEDSVTVLLELE